MSSVHLVVPAGLDDPTRPSGGNTYDRRLRAGLVDRGWVVHEHRVPGGWPVADDDAHRSLAAQIAAAPDGAVVVVDGLVASAAPETVRRHAGRVRLVVLVHLPLGVEVAGVGPVAEREQAALSQASAVVATSEWARGWLASVYGLPSGLLSVAEPGADQAPLAAPTDGGTRLLCVGALVRHKGQDVLVAALRQLMARSWECRLVGAEVEPGYADSLRAGVRDAGLDARVAFDGPVVGDRLAAIYAASDLLVVPSRVETYGMVVSEALAHGIPVIATCVGGLPATLGHDAAGERPGVLVPAGDADALTRALDGWLTDGTRRRRLRTAAVGRRPTVRSWTQTVDRVAQVIGQVAA